MQCPGQDTQYWQPGDIFEALCPKCGRSIEFFKDDASRRCKGCGAKVSNPKLDFGCAESCAYADQCLAGISAETLKPSKEHEKDNGTHAEQDVSAAHKEIDP